MSIERPIRLLIVEDEDPARNRLRAIAETRDNVLVVGDASTVEEALHEIVTKAPDLVLLDVRLRDSDAFALIERVGLEAMPAIVFVTAFDRYAVEAFRLHAVDYVLKPFDDARIHAALDRAAETVARWRSRKSVGELAALGARLRREPAASERIAVRTTGKVVMVPAAEILWIDAAGGDCRLHQRGGGDLKVRRSIGDLETALDPRRFLRIHRSTIVNVDAIRELVMNEYGDYTAILEGGQRLSVSRSYRARLEEML